jgi:hypothetical protein
MRVAGRRVGGLADMAATAADAPLRIGSRGGCHHAAAAASSEEERDEGGAKEQGNDSEGDSI